MRQRRVLLLGLLVLVGGLLPGLVAQTQDTTDRPQPSIEITGVNASDLPTLTINGNVLNARNQPAASLTTADFTLSGELADLATITTVENIAADDLPFASVLAIDVSSSMAGQPLDDAKEAARLFVQSVGDDDPVAIVTFSSDARLIQDYTTDTQQLINAIDNLAFGGQTALYDAAQLSVDVAADAPIPRRAVVLLSDGNEFGGLSQAARQDAVNRALSQGVPVYTIGLGYFLDDPYLNTLSSESNARFYRSPDSAELSDIYSELARLFRSQYVITLTAPDIALDGTEYSFGLQANTVDGLTNIAESVVRAPIPVPLVELPLPDGAVSDPVTITPQIRADDEIAAVEFRLEGETLAAENNAITINPASYTPGTYALAVRVTDVDGDSGTAEGTLQIAALPPESVRLVTRFGDEPVTEPQTVRVEFNSQTDVRRVIYSIAQNGDTVLEEAISDPANGFELTFDPFNLQPGTYTIRATVENAAETSSSDEIRFDVGDVAPRVGNIGGLEPGDTLDAPATLQLNPQAQPGASITERDVQFVTPGISVPDDLTLQPIAIPPGERALEVTVTDSRGMQNSATLRFSVPPLPPRINLPGAEIRLTAPDTPLDVTIDSQTPLTTVTYEIGSQAGIAEERGGVYAVPVDATALGNGTYTLSLIAENESGQTGSASVSVVIDLPTPTPTFTPTPNVTQTEAALQATSDAEATLVARSTNQAQATSDAVATNEAIEQATREANATTTEQAIQQTTAEAASIATNEAIEQATREANATTTEQAIQQTTAEAASIATNEAIEQATREANATTTEQAIQQTTAEAASIATNEAIEQATREANATTTEQAIQQTTAEAASIATNEAIEQTTEAQQIATDEAIIQVTEQIRQTATVESALTATQADIDQTATRQIEQTATAEIDAQVSATAQEVAAVNSRATLDAQAEARVTRAAELTETTVAQSTQQAATSEALSVQQTETEAAIPTDTETPLPTATVTITHTPEPTATATATVTATHTPELPTLTPAVIEEVDAQDAPPVPANSTGLLLAAAGAALFILLVLLLLRGRRQRREG